MERKQRWCKIIVSEGLTNACVLTTFALQAVELGGRNVKRIHSRTASSKSPCYSSKHIFLTWESRQKLIIVFKKYLIRRRTMWKGRRSTAKRKKNHVPSWCYAPIVFGWQAYYDHRNTFLYCKHTLITHFFIPMPKCNVSSIY